MKLLELPDALKNRRLHGFFDDFHWYISPHLFTSLAADAGVTAPAVGDAAGGILTMATGATDNNEVAARTTSEVFLFAADRPAVVEACVQWAEANADDANVAVGWADAFGADLLVDNGAGPKASFSGALLYKVDGETVWRFCTSLGTTRTVTQLADPAGGSAYQTVRIEAREQGAVVELVPFVGGKQCLDAAGRPVKHTITLGSPTEMHAGVYLKAGGANSETLRVDYLAAYQLARVY
jgi:hypothetical protein